MNSYILIIIADILLAIQFALQKQYQRKAGTSIKASLVYTILSGVFSAVIFFVLNGFTLSATWFSVGMAILFAVANSIYILAGFEIMKKGNVSIYTLFLMSGGMIVPYIYGVLFLSETLSLIRILGLLLIVGAIVIANLSKAKVDKKQIIFCIIVFFMNGAVSVISKAHQVSFASKIVSSSDFVFLVNAAKAIIFLPVLFFQGEKSQNTMTVPIKSVFLIVFLAAAVSGISYMLQLIGAVNLPATVLYPLVTGGTIILSSLADLLVFKTRLSSKQWISAGVAFLGTLMFL